MANIKFSAFTQLAPIDQTNSYIVGYEGDANTNNRWTFGEVAIGLKAVTATPYSIYSASGALEATREVTFSAHNLKFIATGNGKLYYQDGNQAAGKVLKSDANGEASWAAETDTNTTYAISALDGDNTDEEKIVLTAGGSGSGTSTVVLEAGTGLTVARSTDKITFTNSSPNQATPAANDGSPSTGQLQYNDGSNGFAASSNLTFTGSGATPDTLTLTDTLDIKGDGTNPGTLKLYCESTTTPHAVSILGPVHSGATPYSIRLPNSLSTTAPYASGGRLLETDATGVLKWIDTSGVTGNLYTADGTIASGRVAKIVDTLEFKTDAATPLSLFKMNVNGTFSLGLNSVNAANSNVVIGDSALTGISNYNNVSIGADATTTNKNESVVVGHDGQANGSGCVAIGSHAHAPTSGVSIGQYAGKDVGGGTGAINIGKACRGSGNKSITISTASSTTGTTQPTTDNAFGVYISSLTTPDFEVIAGGESTLNTSLKVTGQAYTELNSLSNTLTVNWNDSNVQTISGLTGAHTFAPNDPKAGATYILTLIQTGVVTATWGSYIKWAAPDSAATPPTLSGAGKTDVITLICWSATANSGAGGYYGSITKDLS